MLLGLAEAFTVTCHLMTFSQQWTTLYTFLPCCLSSSCKAAQCICHCICLSCSCSGAVRNPFSDRCPLPEPWAKVLKKQHLQLAHSWPSGHWALHYRDHGHGFAVGLNTAMRRLTDVSVHHSYSSGFMRSQWSWKFPIAYWRRSSTHHSRVWWCG